MPLHLVRGSWPRNVRAALNAYSATDDEPGHIFSLGAVIWHADLTTILRLDDYTVGRLFRLTEAHACGLWSDVGTPSERQQNLFAMDTKRTITSCFPFDALALYITTNAARTETVLSLQPV